MQDVYAKYTNSPACEIFKLSCMWNEQTLLQCHLSCINLIVLIGEYSWIALKILIVVDLTELQTCRVSLPDGSGFGLKQGMHMSFLCCSDGYSVPVYEETFWVNNCEHN